MPDLDLEMPTLPDETAVDAEEILNADADDGSEKLRDLDGLNAIDEALGDLGSINLDDIDFGDDGDMPETAPPAPVPPAGDPMSGIRWFYSGGSPLPLPGNPVSTADGPPGEILTFAAGSAARGVDDDMLSSACHRNQAYEKREG